MVDFSQSLLKKIEHLLSQNLGNISRLEHIKKSVIEGRKIYNSDIHYIEELENKNKDSFTKDMEKNSSQNVNNSCWKCGKELADNSKYCSFCGIEQNKSEFDQVLSRRMKSQYNPLKIILNFHSYQILAVIGGLVGLIPILIGIGNLENILNSIEFYTGRDLSKYIVTLGSMGIISGIMCCFAMAIPFLIKKPKKVGRILFFSSFGILILSIIVGIGGFVIILFAGIMALKKKRY